MAASLPLPSNDAGSEAAETVGDHHSRRCGARKIAANFTAKLNLRLRERRRRIRALAVGRIVAGLFTALFQKFGDEVRSIRSGDCADACAIVAVEILVECRRSFQCGSLWLRFFAPCDGAADHLLRAEKDA